MTDRSGTSVTDRKESSVTDRQDRKVVIEMAVGKEKTTITREVSRIIGAVIIILQAIETTARIIRIVRENRTQD